MHFAIVGNGWSAARFRTVINNLGWTSETLRLPREPGERTKALQTAVRIGKDKDAFVVTSPPLVQIKDATALTAMGARVLVEKPVGLDVAAVRELRSVSKSSQTAVLTAYHLAVNPLITRLRAPEVATVLGEIYHARFRMDVSAMRPSNSWLHDSTRSGGIIVETLVHGFHLLELLLGPIDEVVAAQELSGRAATVLLRHVSGASSSVEGVWGARTSTRRGHLELFGTRGTAGFYRGCGVAYEVCFDAVDQDLVTYREPNEDVGFEILLASIGAGVPLDSAVEAAAGLEGAERALNAALMAQILATGANR